MSVIYKFLFPSKPDGTAMSLLILALRILFGILLMSHGVQKWANYDVMSGSFPDPLGIGSQLSLVLSAMCYAVNVKRRLKNWQSIICSFIMN